MANSMVATVSPEAQASQNTVHITQEVLSRLLSSRISWLRISFSPSSRSEITSAQMLAAISRPNTITNRRPTCCEGLRLRRKLLMYPSTP